LYCIDLIWLQINVFLSRLYGEPIGFSVVGIFVIDKNTILTVRHACNTSKLFQYATRCLDKKRNRKASNFVLRCEQI